MIALARKTLVYEWRRFVPVVLAVGFSGLMLVVQAALVLGIFGACAIRERVSADLWAGYPGTQSVNFGRTVSADAEMRLRMDPEVVAVEPYQWVDGDWTPERVDAGSVSIYLSGIAVGPDAMLFSKLLSPDLRKPARAGAVIVDSAGPGIAGRGGRRHGLVNGHPVRVVAAIAGLRGLGGVNVLASLDSARVIGGPQAGRGSTITWRGWPILRGRRRCRRGWRKATPASVRCRSGRPRNSRSAHSSTGCWIPARAWPCCSWP